MKISTQLALLVTLLGLIVASQNCSRVQFEGVNQSQNQSSPQSIKEQIEEPPPQTGPTNGDGYTGKLTRYLEPTPVGFCADQKAKSEIHEMGGNFDLVRENCSAIAAIRLKSELVIVEEGSLSYQGTGYLKSFPKSCGEIYDLGAADGNGQYWIDRDGEGGEEPVSVYCDMTLAGLGWGPWSDWSACDAPCGQTGNQNRQRSCHSGQCTGEENQQRECRTECVP